VPVIVKSASELAAIVSESPITPAADEHPRFLVAFAQDTKALSSLAAIESLVVPPERFAIGKNAAYLLCATGILESKAGEALLGKTGRLATTTSRNWATVIKLQALAREATRNPWLPHARPALASDAPSPALIRAATAESEAVVDELRTGLGRHTRSFGGFAFRSQSPGR